MEKHAHLYNPPAKRYYKVDVEFLSSMFDINEVEYLTKSSTLDMIDITSNIFVFLISGKYFLTKRNLTSFIDND